MTVYYSHYQMIDVQLKALEQIITNTSREASEERLETTYIVGYYYWISTHGSESHTQVPEQFQLISIGHCDCFRILRHSLYAMSLGLSVLVLIFESTLHKLSPSYIMVLTADN